MSIVEDAWSIAEQYALRNDAMHSGYCDSVAAGELEEVKASIEAAQRFVSQTIEEVEDRLRWMRILRVVRSVYVKADGTPTSQGQRLLSLKEELEKDPVEQSKGKPVSDSPLAPSVVY